MSSATADDPTERIRALASRAAGAGSTGYWDMPEAKVTWAFEAGLPDPTTFPIDDLLRLSDAVLREDAADGLQYGGGRHGSIVYGWEGLRDRLAERTLALDRRDVGRRELMLTSGGVQALSLACGGFIDPGDAVVVEAPTWGAVITAARVAGAEPVAVPVDGDGLRVDLLRRKLEALAAEGRSIKLVYTIGAFHTPTGVCLSLERKRELLELADRYGFIVLEDNVYGDLRYDGDPIPTLFSLDETGLVVKVDSFSKTLAPALRLGWVTGHAEAIAALSAVRGDLGVSQWLARVMEAYLAEGLYEPHIRRVNALYRTKRDVACKALEKHCSDLLTWNRPDGGYFLWCQLAPGFDGRQVLMKALAEGVVCRPGERFFGDEDSAGKPVSAGGLFRLSFSMVPAEEIERGIEVLGRAIRASAA